MSEGSAKTQLQLNSVQSLRFDKLRLAGFKSFVDPTDFLVEPGLTGIVGPNGCGKSNLLEAIRWVMGANSAKAMRGKAMDDVIFSGTKQRPGRSSAQVTLTIDNSARVAPAQFNDEDTLEVSRHIQKGGGSTYKVNGKTVRAKDVQLLFADSSTGANSPALVRQGQISELIASKPQNRRRILEEAAGISGLHSRRHESELRLRAAENNLLRLDDHVGQIEGMLHTLKRQGRQARRYKRLAGEIMEYRALLWMKRWNTALAALQIADEENRATTSAVADRAKEASEATRRAHELDGLLAPKREEMMVAAAVLARLNAAKENLETDERAAKAEIEGLEAQIAQLKADLARELGMVEDAGAAEARLSAEFEALAPLADLATELADAERDSTQAFQARSDLEELFNEMTRRNADRMARRDGAERRRDQAVTRLERLEKERERTQSRLSALGNGPSADTSNLFASAATAALSTLDEARQSESALREAWEATETSVEDARGALAKARRELGELEAEARALSKMLRQGGDADYAPALSQIDVDAGYEQALAAALGEDLDAAIGEAGETRWAGADVSPVAFGADAILLRDVVRAPKELNARLSFIGVVEAGAFDAARKALLPGQRIVTREGRLARWDGFEVEAGALTNAALKLQNQNRLAEIDAEMSAAKAAVETAQAAFDAAREARETANTTMRDARRALPDLEAKERSAQSALARYEADVAREASERQGLEERLEVLAGDLRETTEQKAQAETDIDAIGETDSLQAEQEALSARLLAARDAADEASAKYRSLKSDADARAARRAAIENERADWARRGEKAADRVESLETRLTVAEQKLSGAKSGPDPFAERRNKLFAELETAEARQSSAQDALSTAESEARDANMGAREAENAHASARESRAGAEARFTAAQERVAETRARVQETLSCEPDELSARLGSLLPDNPMSELDVEKRVEKLSAERERLGAVNLRADEEAEEQTARLDELTKERDELIAAIAKLREGIDELNNEGRARLLTAFDEVNGHFQTLFTTLFQGGEASLALTESDDPLEAGLEIMAAPPGKQIGAMSLLSGGEQALTATALIFAVFLSNPAPICVLDEVDAPLDDANVGRYCDMLDEMSKMTATKFIAITHNAVTMSRMNRLFGVTMAERGVSQLVSVRLEEATELVAAE